MDAKVISIPKTYIIVVLLSGVFAKAAKKVE